MTEKHVEPGNLAAPGAPLATIEREGAYRLEASVEESRLRDVRAGQSVSVALDAWTAPSQARVGEIVPAVDAASRTYIVKIDLPAVAAAALRHVRARGLHAGQAQRAGRAGRPPSREHGQLRSVLVAEGGLRPRPPGHLGEARQDRREVLSGLTAGEKIDLPGPGGLGRRRPGGGPPVSDNPHYGIAGKLAAAWIQSKLTPLVIVASLALGAFAVWKLPREEEPQIIVPMIDVFVRMPGASAREVEERVTKPMEKLLWEIPGVEYVYSTSSPGMSHGHRALLRGRGRREEHRPAEPEDVTPTST